MRMLSLLLLVSLVLTTGTTNAQQKFKLDTAEFFIDERPLEITLSTDLKNLLSKRKKKEYQPATVTMKFPDSSSVTEDIRMQARGEFRLNNCYMPSIMLNFKNQTSPKLKPLGKLKLVCGCGVSNDDEQLIIKEYLAYKIYNLLTEKSFRIRLLRIRYDDVKNKVKDYTQYGFLIEDVDEMAKRNKCKEVEGKSWYTESTDRQQMTLVALYQYMIGNCDWSIPNYHNIKLIRTAKDSTTLPMVVPYDLDYCGLVNAPYAVPPEELGITSVTERFYRGFPRTMEELQASLDIFRGQKERIYALIKNCQWLSNKYKKEMTNFIEDFYKVTDNKNTLKFTCIDNARTQ